MHLLYLHLESKKEYYDCELSPFSPSPTFRSLDTTSSKMSYIECRKHDGFEDAIFDEKRSLNTSLLIPVLSKCVCVLSMSNL